MTQRPTDLRSRLAGLSHADRIRLERRLSGVRKISDPVRRRRTLATIGEAIDEAEQWIARRRAVVPRRISYPAALPITEHHQDLLTAIRDHQVVVVAGETGSGKSTQLPKLCLELGRGVDGLIGHTQPRRIAARSVAERVAEELGSTVGGLVGYKVRFSDQVGDQTLVKVMTDGILLAEVRHDRHLDAYDTIIVDEAHERSLNVDFLLGYLKALLPRRSDLKVIITSATIDTERFAAHFGGAPVVEVSGRSHPVEIRYRPLEGPDDPEPRDQPQGICDAVVELTRDGPGDILVFCSGEREIRDAADALDELDLRDTEILPLYGRLSAAEQHRVFEPHQGRRIVLATNVAETSLTVPGIRSVVDPGTARISRFSRRTKVQQLPIEPISQASAAQRAGRCGRLGPGVCIRLYSEQDFDSRAEYTEPEILRTSLAAVLLQMAAIGLGDIEAFPFLDPPDARSIRDGIALLEELGAVDPTQTGNRNWLTDTGRKLARLPLDPRLGRMVLEADRNGCLREVLIIASALAIQDPRERPTGKEQHADQLHARFAHPDSDLLSWLALWRNLRTERRERTSSAFRRMCRDEFLNYRRVREWQDVHAQLREVADELELSMNREPADAEVIHRALLAGLLSHVGLKDPDGYEYRGARGARFSIAPGSALFKKAPRWVMAAELVETTRLWARGIAPILPEWVEEVGAHLVRRAHSDPWWSPERGSAVANETVTIFGIPLVDRRTVQVGRIDPETARALFIRHALVAGEWDTHHGFDARNRERIAEVHELEKRLRRVDLMVDEDTLVAHFDRHIPAEVVSVRHFDRWWKETRGTAPRLLDLSIDDLIDPAAGSLDEELFPETWHHGDVSMPIVYEFDPTSPSDGLTIDIPLDQIDRVDPAAFEWQIPGLRYELVTELIRSLPKRLRRSFVPIPETAAEVLERLDPEQGGLLETLRRELSRMAGEAVPVDALNPARLPPHLQARFRVSNAEGTVLAEGTDLRRLKADLVEEVRTGLSTMSHPLEREGLTRWDFGELPRTVEVAGPGGRATAYPALVDEGQTVGIRLLATPDDQAERMWEGTRRLLLLSLPSPQRLLRPILTEDAKLALATSPYETPAAWMEDCLRCAIDRTMLESGAPAWDAVGFDRLLLRAKNDLAEAVTTVGHESAAVLTSLRSVYLRAEALTAEAFRPSLDDVATQLSRLVFPGFVGALGAARLSDIGRYLRAIAHRLERLPERLHRDREDMVRIQALESEYDRLLDLLPVSERLAEVGWMLQELRVSLFAQTIGARGGVSEKRLRDHLEKLARGE